MKRLLNAYGVNRDPAILAGISVLEDSNKRRQMVLWTIVCLRWPLLAEALIETPDYADAFFETEPKKPIPEEFRNLFESETARKVFRGDGIGVSLDKAAIKEFNGIPNL
jgi:hypothetical protein